MVIWLACKFYKNKKGRRTYAAYQPTMISCSPLLYGGSAEQNCRTLMTMWWSLNNLLQLFSPVLFVWWVKVSSSRWLATLKINNNYKVQCCFSLPSFVHFDHVFAEREKKCYKNIKNAATNKTPAYKVSSSFKEVNFPLFLKLEESPFKTKNQ